MWRFDRIHGSFILGFLRKRGEEIFEVLWSRAENKIENGGWKCCIFFYFDERVELMEVVIFYHQSFWSFFNFFTQVDYDYFSACMFYSLRYCYIDIYTAFYSWLYFSFTWHWHTIIICACIGFFDKNIFWQQLNFSACAHYNKDYSISLLHCVAHTSINQAF